ncbi:MAG: hypothetical protein ACYDAO_04180 [Thermoplasmataceae archaeon]
MDNTNYTPSKAMLRAEKIISTFSKEMKEVSGFLKGMAMSVGDAYAHQVPAIRGKLPTKGELERYAKRRWHHSLTDEITEQLKHYYIPVTITNIKLLTEIFYLAFLDEWLHYQRNPMSYSGELDSIAFYSVDELKAHGFPDTTDMLK